jgi:hypothetical protein
MEAKKRHLPFLTGMASIHSRWGLYFEQDEYIEIAYPIWRSLGNIATEPHRFIETVPQDGVLLLPSGCEFVNSVSTIAFRDEEGMDRSSTKRSFSSSGASKAVRPDKSRLSITSAINLPEGYIEGDSVDWVLEEGVIRVTSKHMVDSTVLVRYAAIAVDEDGLPLLNDKELEALKYNVALARVEQDLFKKIPGADKLVAYIKPEAIRTLAAAKIPEKITDDTLDEALNIKTSLGFKSFGDKYYFRK